MTEPPSNWNLVTNLDHQLIYQQTNVPDDEPKKTLVLLNNGTPSNWKVKGLLGFNDTPSNEYPIFADSTTLDQAKVIAHDVMDGDTTVSPIRTESVADNMNQSDNSESDTQDSESDVLEGEDETSSDKDGSDADESSSSSDKSNAELTDFM